MNKEKHEELAVIRNVGFGMRDAPWPCLWFITDVLHGGALQVLHYEDAAKLIKKHHIENIEHLEGKPCIVEIDGGIGGKVIFKDLKDD